MESIDITCQNLIKAFSEQKDDPVSLMTIIDLYIDQVDLEGTRTEKEQFLDTLLEQLLAHSKVVSQIGWDLPRGLLKFYNKRNVKVNARLSSSKIVVSVMKCFNEIALSGNPKECLLSGCQLLSELSVSQIVKDFNDDDDENNVEEEGRDPIAFFLGIKTYVLFELIQAVLKRISSLYPSKFLGMAVSAIIKFAKTNIDDIDNTNFLLRRIFTFCRSYIPPDMPEDVVKESKLNKVELHKITDDESVLQGKLLRSLCTFAVGYCLKNKSTRLDVRYFYALTGTPYTQPEYYEQVVTICARYYQLAFSFDIDLKDSFLKYVDDTRNIYKSLPPDSEVSNEEAKRAIGQVVYQLSYTYQLQKLAKSKGLELDPYGIFILSGFHYDETKKHLYPEISVQDAVYLYIRCTTPSLFSEFYHNATAEATARYWLWVAITNSPFKDIKKHFSELSSYISNVFLQMLLLKNCNKVNEEVRMVNFTLLTRVLCSMPEEISFSFILDTLLTCPYVQPKVCVLGILKDLTLKTCQCKKDLSGLLEGLKLDSNTPEDKGVTSAPLPPPRPYILLNEDRMAAIHSVGLIAIETVSKNLDDKDALILVQNYLNFFNALRNKWDKNLLRAIHSEVASSFNDKTEETVSEIGYIKIANDTLVKNL